MSDSPPFPFCLDCIHCKATPIGDERRPGRRHVQGRWVEIVCMDAYDPATGIRGEVVSKERSSNGFCGVMGKNFTPKESPPTPPDDEDFAEVNEMGGLHE